MKMFSDCSGECCVCDIGNECLAGHGDDYFCVASKEKIIERLDNGNYPSYKQYMIDFLKKNYNYDYENKEDYLVSVVRCRDCIYKILRGNAQFVYYYCDRGIVTKPDGFCSYGERKE